jgi:hypothetical protein
MKKRKQFARSVDMNSQLKLKLDWCSHEAAKYACEHWHYSRCIPKSKIVKIGVWEHKEFIGVVIFGVGATSSLVQKYGLKTTQGCELVRIALRKHNTPVSRIISIAISFLRKSNPGLRLIVSFADPDQGHHGGIYQAGGWVFNGNSQSSDEYIFKGKRWQGRSFRHNFKGMGKDPRVKIVKGSSKHRYLMPLDNEMRIQIIPLSKPYPKRAEGETKDTLAIHAREGGSLPTSALHTSSEVKNG